MLIDIHIAHFHKVSYIEYDNYSTTETVYNYPYCSKNKSKIRSFSLDHRCFSKTQTDK